MFRVAALLVACIGMAVGLSGGTTRRHPVTTLYVPAAPPAFPLRRAAGGRYLVDRSNRPFLIQGDAGWSILAQLRKEDVETYLEDRRRRGFDTILINLVEHKFADHAPENAYGVPPFTRPGDFSTPNDAYFDYAAWVMDLARSKGFEVLLTPAYLGQEGGDEGWYQEIVRSGSAALRGYGAYVARRFANLDNFIWVLGGDYTPPPEGMAIVEAMAEGIRANDLDPAGRPAHLFTAHWSAEDSSLDPTTRARIDVNATYTYGPVHEKSLADDVRPDRLPHFLIETAYELEHESTPLSLRAQAYGALLTGACGQVFGNSKIWEFVRRWQGQLGSDGSVGMTNVRALFEPRPWPSLVPDARNEVLVAGMGPRDGDELALLARSGDGSLALAYLPGLRTITIDLARLRLPLRARWYDPTAGTYRDAAGSPFQEARMTDFAPGTTNAAGDRDWVLVLETLEGTH
ncbi:MAG TPA: DUF4038 domain-containing protein [Polyangiaceae bacterium]|nr:DUF4038 domain-containing protein [Polyangiaceae bacterium]